MGAEKNDKDEKDAKASEKEPASEKQERGAKDGDETAEAAPDEAGDAAAEEEAAADAKEPSSPWPSARKGESKSASAGAKATPHKAAWGAPLDRLDRAWTKLDTRLCAAVLVAEAVALVFWLSVDAMSKTGKGGPGMTFRILLSAVVLGTVAHFATKRHPKHQLITTVAVFAGIGLGTQWGELGATYFANYYGWMQSASILVFFGGIGEIAKRLTFLLALLGASVATGQGKHITVDVVMRVLSPKARVPVAVLGWLVAAVVSASAAWGFFDAVAVEQFQVPLDVPCAGAPEGASATCATPAGEKVSRVTKIMGRNMFLAGRQLSLDLRTFPKVLGGTPYGKWLGAREWNAWLRDGGWDDHFKKEDVKALELPEDGADTRTPAVTAIPGGTERIEQLMVPMLNLIFPFGMFVIAVRFVIRALLAIGGWVNVDPDAAHGDDELAHAHDPNTPSVETEEGAS